MSPFLDTPGINHSYHHYHRDQHSALFPLLCRYLSFIVLFCIRAYILYVTRTSMVQCQIHVQYTTNSSVFICNVRKSYYDIYTCPYSNHRCLLLFQLQDIRLGIIAEHTVNVLNTPCCLFYKIQRCSLLNGVADVHVVCVGVYVYHGCLMNKKTQHKRSAIGTSCSKKSCILRSSLSWGKVQSSFPGLLHTRPRQVDQRLGTTPSRNPVLARPVRARKHKVLWCHSVEYPSPSAPPHPHPVSV